MSGEEEPCDDTEHGYPREAFPDEPDLQSMSCCSSSTDTNCSSTTSTSNSINSFFETKCNLANLSTKPHKSNDAVWAVLNRLQSETPAQLSLDKFRFLQRLGSGDIGSVYLTELKGSNGLYLAMKVMDKKELLTRSKLARAKIEREILEMVDHPFLPTLYAHLDCNRWSCLLTEFCPGGDLHVLRQRQPCKRFTEPSARFYASEVVVALEYIHMLGIVYRDLKPENVLVREDGHILLTDFDLSLKSDQPTTTTLLLPTQISSAAATSTVSADSFAASSCILPNCIAPAVSCLHLKRRRRKKNPAASLPELLAEPIDARSMSFVGTHEYLSPEIISGEGHGNAVDWWTLGIFLYELLYGTTPFKGADNDATLANIVARALEFPGDIATSAAARDLISSLLIKDPSQRMGSTKGATQIKQHPFFNGVNWALLRCTAPPYVPPAFDTVHVAEDAELLDDDGDEESCPVEYY